MLEKLMLVNLEKLTGKKALVMSMSLAHVSAILKSSPKFLRSFGYEKYYYLQLYSGDLGALEGLRHLKTLSFRDCKKITGKGTFARAILLGQVLPHLSADARLKHYSFCLCNSNQATSACSRA